MAKHMTYIFSDDARAQAAFYTQALGGEILSVMTHGEIPGASEALKAHEAFNNLAEGGKVWDSLKPAFWGSLFGQVEDKYGITWMITTEAKSG